MDHRMQGLHPAVHHLGKLGQRRDVADREPRLAQRGRRCRRSRRARRRGRRGRGRGRRGRSCRKRKATPAGRARDRETCGSCLRVTGFSGWSAASAIRARDQVTWPRYSTTSARTTTCRVGRGSGAAGSKQTESSSPTVPPPARNSHSSPEGSARSDALPAFVELGRHLGVEMEACGEGQAAARRHALELGAGAGVGDGEDLLAADLLPAGVDEEPPLLQEPVTGHVAVLGGEEPLAGGVLRLPDRDVRRPVDEARPEGAGGEAGRLEPGGRAAVDLDGGMGGGLAREERPVPAERPPGPGVHDEPLAADAHLEGQRAGVGAGRRRPSRRRGAVHDHDEAAAREADEAERELRLLAGSSGEARRAPGRAAPGRRRRRR